MKKKFKDTKLSAFLGKVTNIGLDVAPIIAKASQGNVLGAISDTVKLLKGNVSIDSIELLDELTIQKKNIELDYYRVTQENVSKRWELDMTSDSWLSKNIRPLTLAWLIVSNTTICILDSSNVLDVKEMWVSLFGNVLLTVIVAYFGSRGAEKVLKK